MTALALRYWRELLIGALTVALAASLLIGSARLARCEQRTTETIAALDKTKSDYVAAQAKAAEQNVQQVRAIEQQNAAKTQEIQDDLTTRLDAARAAGDAHAARLREQAEASRRAAGATGVPVEADAASNTDGTGGASLLANDIRICSENTVKAQGWQDWWSAVK